MRRQEIPYNQVRTQLSAVAIMAGGDVRRGTRPRRGKETQKVHVKLNSPILRSMIVAASGGFLFGFDTAALAAAVTLSNRFAHL